MYIYGRNPVLEALRAGDAIEKIFVLHGREMGPMGEIFTRAKQRGVVVVIAPKDKFFAMIDSVGDTIGETVTHQGVIALRSEINFVSMEDIYAAAATKSERPLIVLLDEIEDPHNAGAIIRTAECAGAHGVVIVKHHSAAITPLVVKVSSGAAQYIPIVKAGNLAQTIDALKKENIWVVGAAEEGASVYTSFDYRQPVAIVIGAEGKGLRRLIKEKCDALVNIPMHGKTSSLNASVAAGVLLFEAARQRSA